MSRLITLWRLLNLPCEQITRLASESLDRDLDRMERAALRSHLFYCVACRRYSRQIRQIRAALRRLAARDAAVDVPGEADLDAHGPALPDDVRERIRRALKEPH
jgi:predicted anti-sigma-YlaC factor YlaD